MKNTQELYWSLYTLEYRQSMCIPGQLVLSFNTAWRVFYGRGLLSIVLDIPEDMDWDGFLILCSERLFLYKNYRTYMDNHARSPLNPKELLGIQYSESNDICW